MYRLNLRTAQTVEFTDITGEVQHIVEASGVKDGICHIYIPHTTAGVTVNEHADPSVVKDICMALERIVSRKDNYRHSEGNSPAHIKASLFGSSQTVFIEKGKLVLGTWQGIFFCEFDGPRDRTVLVKAMSG